MSVPLLLFLLPFPNLPIPCSCLHTAGTAPPNRNGAAQSASNRDTNPGKHKQHTEYRTLLDITCSPFEPTLQEGQINQRLRLRMNNRMGVGWEKHVRGKYLDSRAVALI